MFGLKKTNQLAISLIFVLLFSGCSLKDVGGKLKKLDDKVGQSFDKMQQKQQEEVINFFGEKKGLPKAKDLTKEQKEKIDIWIEKNNLNRYGDPAETIYAGGTPLFNEATGESVDRYDYILKNHPSLLDE
ncbi:MAG: hypothetical protein PHZ04_01180 [Patescibacteria group bacterium]|nr:hypothetical protein [Patescibacteria group bacterium]MDD5294477.1 hypothetical protein [Patescibacteria group bacterium]MDD5554407.1 hypothetical protein [Patescibacteria group bacterium]